MKSINILAYSAGKDSTAMWLDSIDNGIDVTPVFCDTGNEHAMTYEYLEYIENRLGPVKRIKADFATQIERKREYIVNHWPRKLTADILGHWHTDDDENQFPAPDWEPTKLGAAVNGWTWIDEQKGLSDKEAAEVVEKALAVLYPTGNPFLDMSMWKGRFPSTKARFCTVELKVRPTWEQVYSPLLEEGFDVTSMQGVRAQESAARAKLPIREDTPEGYHIYRPLLHWTVEDVFAIHKRHGVDPNPLYKLGMGRVGCMPCVNCNKQELFEIARRFPDEIARIAEWERIVKFASKRQASSFFPTSRTHNGIHDEVEWSKTARGGQQYDLLKYLEKDDIPVCSSQYGLCE